MNSRGGYLYLVMVVVLLVAAAQVVLLLGCFIIPEFLEIVVVVVPLKIPSIFEFDNYSQSLFAVYF